MAGWNEPIIKEFRENGGKAGLFVFRRYRKCAAIRPRRLGPDVKDIGALPHHLGSTRDCRSRLQKLAAIRKRIRGYIEYTHDQRTAC